MTEVGVALTKFAHVLAVKTLSSFLASPRQFYKMPSVVKADKHKTLDFSDMKICKNVNLRIDELK